MLSESLSGKLALVTGGASGIGKCTCQLLAKLGASVIVTDLKLDQCETVKRELSNQSLNHSAFEMNVTCLKSIQKTVADILAKYKRPPTIVVHSAGIAYDISKPSVEMSDDSWDMVVDVNLKGTFYVNKTFARLMLDAKLAGSIVNLSSQAKDGYPKGISYAASKAGVVGVTTTMAKEYGRYNIRCNAVAPGMIDTPMVRLNRPHILEAFIRSSAMKRMGRPEEVANLCVFLASDASSYINGETIMINGGKL